MLLKVEKVRAQIKAICIFSGFFEFNSRKMGKQIQISENVFFLSVQNICFYKLIAERLRESRITKVIFTINKSNVLCYTITELVNQVMSPIGCFCTAASITASLKRVKGIILCQWC